ncbi:T9SS type A sorting domain-containing protein [Ferruginibacter albus]|uniref:T9SS type A sorting domain-containing protein n=1 Tax=Ferruginibacter albus TaxID=2875540 RepID=UPI001CC595E2|nr:T9SS type A sorting domain-containing protein [Ferruginibacter albus]UAY52202.1 T9SS type A sorting domain-containing protein [Ferruginibacter albus]
MHISFTKIFFAVVFVLTGSIVTAQNSILVNFGSNSCGLTTTPAFSLITQPLTPNASVITSCSLSQQMPDYFNVFIAYNPKDNKIYLCDIRSGISKVWMLDMGLPGDITCPPTIPLDPTYTYSYLPNNFEFDNSGNLWSFRNYDPTTGTAFIDQFDVTTGNVFSTRTIQFPPGNFPTDMGSGDITILPNGRMFATFGSFPSQLYEILNYNGTGNATANYLLTLPQNTFGISYLNGKLEITGTDNAFTCYYYEYDIFSNTLSDPLPFQNGQAPIDNTSISPAIGATKRLLNGQRIGTNAADLTYEIYVRNMGNVILNNINAVDDLGAAFGTANVSNVHVSFAPNGNFAGLTLNDNYNGTTNVNLLNTGQSLPNLTSDNKDYFFVVLLKCRVSNLILDTNHIYNNSAIASATVGNALSTINISDSSNNGAQDVIDPNANSYAGDPGENVPTPFSISALGGPLPVTFLNTTGTLINNDAVIKWNIATPVINAKQFWVEYSIDSRNWTALAPVAITDNNQSAYQFTHSDIPSGNIYYRVKEMDASGTIIYSSVILLNNVAKNKYIIYPNPANNYIIISSLLKGNCKAELFDAVGRKLFEKIITTSTTQINTTLLPDGNYLLRLWDNENAVTQKITVTH